MYAKARLVLALRLAGAAHALDLEYLVQGLEPLLRSLAADELFQLGVVEFGDAATAITDKELARM